ncbi:MAG: FG-GAP repeat protein [Granulosicoccus sp.]|nr:FG-GAP repeat protein [Granulosicoccus sp.]
MKFSLTVFFQSIHRVALVCTCSLIIYRCTGSSDSQPGNLQSDGESEVDTLNVESGDSNADVPNNDISNSTDISSVTAPSPPAGTEEAIELVQAIQATLEILPHKTFRISWQTTGNAQYFRVLENPDGVSGYYQISGDLAPSQQTFDHRVALYSRVGARYIVQACSATGCTDSDELLVSGTLENAIGYIQAGNIEPGDYFGSSVSISAEGKTLAIAAPVENSSATGVNGNQDDNSAHSAGAVYVFVLNNGNWQQQAYLKATNTDKGDNFGMAVSLSSDGHILAVAASNEGSAATGINGNQLDNSYEAAGAVYVFARDNGQWQQQAYVKAPSNYNLGHFGGYGIAGALSLDADGDTLAIGTSARIAGTFWGEAPASYQAVYLY